MFVGSAAYIARKDLSKIFRVLKKPAENFVKDVKAEIDATKPATFGSSPVAPPTVVPPSDGIKEDESAKKSPQ